MWPRSDERGIVFCLNGYTTTSIASMWPRSDERGIAANDYNVGYWDSPRLQCGRAPMSAESRTAVAKRGNKEHLELQCGRAPMSAESYLERRFGLTVILYASMWPRSDERGIDDDEDDEDEDEDDASMWPRSDERGIGNRYAVVAWPMGAGFNVAALR